MKLAKPINFLFAIVTACIFSPWIAKGSVVGGELTYVCLSDSTYRFFFTVYNSCDGSLANSAYDLCVYNSCNPSNNYTIPMSKWTGTLLNGQPNGTPLTSACPGNPTKCENLSSTISNNEQWIYSTVLTLNSRCNAWRFSVNINNRPTNNNLNAANFYVETIFNNRDFQGNSSPFYTVKPRPFNCLNQSQEYNNGVLDNNGDSLYTEVIYPMTSNSCSGMPANTTFQSSSPAYSISANPFQTNNSFNLNPLTGKMIYTPTLSGASTITIRTKEYRNDSLVGSVMRDVQVDMLSGCNIPSVSVAPAVNTFSGIGYNSGIVYTCVSQAISFCFDAKATSPGSSLFVSDNHAFSFPSANITYTNQKSDSVRGCFLWTPTLNDTGYQYFIINVQDSTCSGGGKVYTHTITMPVFVHGPVVVLKDTAVCPNTPVQLHASGGASTTSFFWNTLPGGSGAASLNCNNCNNPIVTPSVTTFYIATSTSSYCSSNDTVEVAALHTPAFTPIKDTTTCPNTPVMLNLHPVPPTSVKYRYKWTPSTYLSNDTLSNPVSNTKVDISYNVVISTDNSPCKQYDTVNIKVLKGFSMNMSDTAICIESSINAYATGDTNYLYKWASSKPGTTLIQPYDTILNPIITVQSLGILTLVLRGSYPGCIDSIAHITIDVQPYPSVYAGKDVALCLGGKVKLEGEVSPSTYPFNLSWVPSTNMDSPYIASPTYTSSAVGLQTLKLKATSSAGCSDSDEVIVTVYTEELLTILTPDTAICGGDTITLRMTGSGQNSFVWFPKFDMDDPFSYTPTVSPVESITYYAWASDMNSCTDTESVTVFVKPKAIIQLPDSLELAPGEEYTMDPLGNCLYFNWFPTKPLSKSNIANPTALPDSTTTFYVTGKTEFGCSANDSIKLKLAPDSRIAMPNAFSPRGKNRIIKPAYNGTVILNKFSIYNRWGMKLFETTDINEGWDGTYKGELQPTEVYIYTIDASTVKGVPFIRQGNITLIR